MNINDAKALIWNRIITSGLIDTTKIDFSNANQGGFDTPASGLWVRPTVRISSGRVASLGGDGVAKRRERGGVIVIDVFSDLKGGEYEADTLADEFILLFEGQADRPVFYRDFALVDSRRDDAWWLSRVSGSFDFDVVCV